jgi:hypothetical protein
MPEKHWNAVIRVIFHTLAQVRYSAATCGASVSKTMQFAPAVKTGAMLGSDSGHHLCIRSDQIGYSCFCGAVFEFAHHFFKAMRNVHVTIE